jgi:NAD-specific glutamate dehydrogenase
VQLADAVSRSFPFDLVAVVLAGYAGAAWLLLRDRPDRAVASGSVRQPAHQALALLGERHHRGGRPGPLDVRDHGRLAALHGGDHRVGGPQVDALLPSA